MRGWSVGGGGDCEYGADDTMSDRASHLYRCRIRGRRGVKEKKKKKGPSSTLR